MTDARMKAMRCDRCHEVIGVYEPLVLISEGVARETSRAAESELCRRVSERYHKACYAAKGVQGAEG